VGQGGLSETNKLKKNWLPSADNKIGSTHFTDGKPTAAHPYPTQYLGVNVATPVLTNK